MSEKFDVKRMVQHSLRVHCDGHEGDALDKLLPKMSEQEKVARWLVEKLGLVWDDLDEDRLEFYLAEAGQVITLATPEREAMERDHAAMESLRDGRRWFYDGIHLRQVFYPEEEGHPDPADAIFASLEADDARHG